MKRWVSVLLLISMMAAFCPHSFAESSPVPAPPADIVSPELPPEGESDDGVVEKMFTPALTDMVNMSISGWYLDKDTRARLTISLVFDWYTTVMDASNDDIANFIELLSIWLSPSWVGRDELFLYVGIVTKDRIILIAYSPLTCSAVSYTAPCDNEIGGELMIEALLTDLCMDRFVRNDELAIESFVEFLLTASVA